MLAFVELVHVWSLNNLRLFNKYDLGVVLVWRLVNQGFEGLADPDHL